MKTSSIVAVLTACLFAAPTFAWQPGAQITVTEAVRITDLDLSRARDRTALQARIRHAAFQACGEASSVDLEGRNEARRCRAEALRLASDQVQRVLAGARGRASGGQLGE